MCNIKSNYEVVKKGIPEGSILDPFLYILEMNELPINIEDHIAMHADDTSLVMNGDVEAEIGLHFEGSFAHLRELFIDNNFLMNMDKYQLLKYATTK